MMTGTLSQCTQTTVHVVFFFALPSNKSCLFEIQCLWVYLAFHAGLSLDLDEFLDIHSITGALKLFLRELPIPLITYKAFEQLLHLLDG